MVHMSDPAICYTRVPYNTGIEDGHSVNHSRKPTPELACSVEVLADVVTRETRPAICSTNLIDPTRGESRMKSQTLWQQELLKGFQS